MIIDLALRAASIRKLKIEIDQYMNAHPGYIRNNTNRGR